MKAPRLNVSSAVLLVKDVKKAANYYRDRVGFSYERFYGEPPSFCILHRDGCYIMLKQADDPHDVIPLWTVSDKLWNIYFWVKNVDALFQQLKKSGAKMDYGLCDQPYGCREFGIQDLDGYDIGFGEMSGEKKKAKPRKKPA